MNTNQKIEKVKEIFKNYEKVALAFSGGADLENLANEAALLAVRRGKKLISMEEMEEAITRVIAGPEKKSRVISEHDRKLTAYHEAGHAVVMKCLKNSDPVHTYFLFIFSNS